ncbi:unnamed protein product [Ixodes persulcatus]
MSLSRLPLLPVPLLHPSFLFSLPSLPLHLYMQSALIYFLQPRTFLCVLPRLRVIFYCFPTISDNVPTTSSAQTGNSHPAMFF